MFYQALGFFDDHFRDLNVARGRFVEGGADDFAFDRTHHVGDFFRAFVDQQHDQVDFRVVESDGVSDVLQHHRLARPGRRYDEGALALPDRANEVDDAGGQIFQFRIVLFHLQEFVGVQRRQVVEVDAVADIAGIGEIDLIDFQQGEVAFAVLGRPDFAFHRVAGPEAETSDLAGRYVNIVGAGQVVGLGAAQETEAVLEHLQNADAENGDFVFGQLLKDGEHHVLLAQRGRVFDFQVFGIGEEVRRVFVFKFL